MRKRRTGMAFSGKSSNGTKGPSHPFNSSTHASSHIDCLSTFGPRCALLIGISNARLGTRASAPKEWTFPRHVRACAGRYLRPTAAHASRQAIGCRMGSKLAALAQVPIPQTTTRRKKKRKEVKWIDAPPATHETVAFGSTELREHRLSVGEFLLLWIAGA